MRRRGGLRRIGPPARDYRDNHVADGLGTAYAQLGDRADTGFPCLPWFDRDPLLEPFVPCGDPPAPCRLARGWKCQSI